MKSKFSKILLLLSLMVSSAALAESFRIEYETLSNDTIAHIEKYKKLETYVKGSHHTTFKFFNLPDGEDYTVRWQRPLLKKKEHHCESSKAMFLKNSQFLNEDIPSFSFVSKGFLPGEKVILSLETKEGEKLGMPVEFFPNPIVQETTNGRSKLLAELSSVNPTCYEITFEGIPSLETLQLHTNSSGEVIDQQFRYTQGSCIGLSPGVIGKKGGFCAFTIKRQNGEKFELKLPWGEELLKHLIGESDQVVTSFSAIRSEPEALK